MDSLENYRILLSIVSEGSFAAAAKALRLSPTKVTRAIAELETEAATVLFHRTTRRVELTEAGANFIQLLNPAMASLEAARLSLSGRQTSHSFKDLRMCCCRASGIGLVAGAAARFVVQHPESNLTLDLHDRHVDAEAEGYDIVLQMAASPAEEAAPGRSLAPIEFALVASPAYCAMHNRPQSVTELMQHRLLIWTRMRRWLLRGAPAMVPQRSHFFNDLMIIPELCIAANGIAVLPQFMVRAALDDRRLIQLLDGFEPKPWQLFARWGARSKPSPAAEIFLQLLSQHLKSLRF